MKLSHKLDFLQKMATEYAEEPYKRYLIDLLAEHAEEDEMSVKLLEWVSIIMKSSLPNKKL